jgi:hypothetical protein
MRRRKGMRRKIVAILLAVMTVSTAVIGCGDNKTTETESKKVQTSTETSDHDEIKKYIKNADEIVIVKDAKNLDLEKAVNSLVSEEQKAKVESVTVDDSKVDSTKAGTYPLTITVKLKAETTEQNIASSTTEKEPDTVKDTVDVIVAEKKDAEDLLNKGSAVIGDDSKVKVKEDKKNASNDGKEEEKKTEDSSKQEVSNKTDSKKEESKKEDTKKNDKKKEPSKQEKTAKNDSKKNETSNKSNTSTSNKKQETTKPSPSTSTTTKPATNSGSNKENSNKTESVHQHNYVAQTHVVHHEATGHNEPYVVQDAWDEQVTTYEDYPWDCCNVCGADCTADPGGHAYQHAIKGEGGGHHTEYDSRPVTKTVHHDAVYGTRWVQDTEAYDETVVDGYVCSCGARK